jgi:hypothetical protein
MSWPLIATIVDCISRVQSFSAQVEFSHHVPSTPVVKTPLSLSKITIAVKEGFQPFSTVFYQLLNVCTVEAYHSFTVVSTYPITSA